MYFILFKNKTNKQINVTVCHEYDLSKMISFGYASQTIQKGIEKIKEYGYWEYSCLGIDFIKNLKEAKRFVKSMCKKLDKEQRSKKIIERDMRILSKKCLNVNFGG